MRVMLIDDSKDMRSIQRSVLAQLGYVEVEEAVDGQDALSKVGAFNPELILLDWGSPPMDGLSFVQQFRRKNRTACLIMVTSECQRSRVVEAIEAGVNGYVVKPFTPDQLAKRIRAALQRARAA